MLSPVKDIVAVSQPRLATWLLMIHKIKYKDGQYGNAKDIFISKIKKSETNSPSNVGSVINLISCWNNYHNFMSIYN